MSSARAIHSLFFSSEDVLFRICSYADVASLARLELVSVTFKRVVDAVYAELVTSVTSPLRRFTYIIRSDFASAKQLCGAAERALKARTGSFLCIGRCFTGGYDDYTCRVSAGVGGEYPSEVSVGVNDAKRLGASSLVTTTTGLRLILGGWSTEQSRCSSNVYSLDPRHSLSDWQDTGCSVYEAPGFSAGLCFTAATTTGDGQIVLTGGGESPYSGARVSDSCAMGVYSHNSLVWTMLPSLTTPRCGHGLVTLTDYSVVAVGGYHGLFGNQSDYLASAERFDFGAQRWVTLPSMSYRRSGAGCVVGVDGCVYAIGGSDDGSHGHMTMERFDPREGRWTLLPNNMSYERGYTAACLGPNKTIFVSGGLSGSLIANCVEYFDPRNETWCDMTSDGGLVVYSPLLERAGHHMTYLWDV